MPDWGGVGVYVKFQSSRSLRTATYGLDGMDMYFPIFQSSRSLRTATPVSDTQAYKQLDFNPRGPCGPRRTIKNIDKIELMISILAVLADRDGEFGPVYHRWLFISILAVLADRDSPSTIAGYKRIRISILAVLADRDRPVGDADVQPLQISILAVLADRDQKWLFCGSELLHFNPRGPCGPRLWGVITATTE